ncbi:MAG: hypothetical protein AAF958_03045 [Planctomycetota bacterium]
MAIRKAVGTGDAGKSRAANERRDPPGDPKSVGGGIRIVATNPHRHAESHLQYVCK